MKIRDMFYKPINRDIKGVIKVGQADDENVYQELEEYVVTTELEEYMTRFFNAYTRSLDDKTNKTGKDKMGVWISGFFGSGKSHFLKILSYLLANKEVTDENGETYTASSFFTEGVKVDSKKLKDKIQQVADLSNDVDVILFNIDSKSESDSKMNKEAIRDVFMKVFNDYLGYCGSIPFLAEFERKLDTDGNYEAFKEKFEEINGSSWEEAREDYYFIQDEIIEAVTDLGIMSEKEANNWAENAQSTYSLSVEKFADCVRRYCDSKGRDHHVIFLVDEIGQYIADDSQLMVNLQTVTEDLGTACKGKAWIVVTSQQDIDSITKTMGNDFSKIQGRFDTRIALSSANVDEVIRKRILYKSDKAAAILRDLYDEYESVIKNIITFSEGTPEMPLYKDADDFAEVYPFIPYQFKLLGNVLTSIRRYSSSGKHLADGERSMLALFKEAAQKVEDEREGILVPFQSFYSALDDFIDHTHRIVISGAARNSRLSNFDVDVLKILFMIKHVNSFKGNVENVTALMVSSVSEDTLELRKKVEASFRLLANEGVVQKNGDEYVFLTHEEQEAENRIRDINIDTKEVVNYVAQIAFEEAIALPNSKYKHNARYQFGFNQQIDDRFIRSNPANHITLHLLTAYCGTDDEHSLSLLSASEKSVVVRMSDDFPYLAETTDMKKIEAFLSKPDLTTLINYEVIRINKQKERNDRVKRISDYVRMALETADIYVRGEKVSTKAKDVQNRINEAFGKLIASEYSKLGDMETAPDNSDILDVLKKTKTQLTLNLDGMREPNADALREMLNFIQMEGKLGKTVSIKKALDQFSGAPYGYTETDIGYLIATLYKKGQISLKMNSVVYSPASTNPEEAFKYITKKDYREKVLLEMKAIPKAQWVKAVKDIIHDFFGKTVMTEDADALMRDFRAYGETKKKEANDTLRDEYKAGSRLPGKELLEKMIRLIDEVNNIKDPMAFYKQVDELYDEFMEMVDDLHDLMGFLSGVQKDKFNSACKIYDIYKKSENYISDPETISYAEQIKKIISLPKPYSFINKLEQFDKALVAAIMRLLEKDAARIEPEVVADRKLAIDSIPEGRPYADILRKRFESRFAALAEKLEKTNELAALNGIPAESSAVLQNCLNDITKEENAYQLALAAQQREEDKVPVKPGKEPVPVKVVKTVPMTMRTLTGGKTYTIKTEDDVDKFLREIKAELTSKLGEDKVIKLS